MKAGRAVRGPDHCHNQNIGASAGDRGLGEGRHGFHGSGGGVG